MFSFIIQFRELTNFLFLSLSYICSSSLSYIWGEEEEERVVPLPPPPQNAMGWLLSNRYLLNHSRGLRQRGARQEVRIILFNQLIQELIYTLLYMIQHRAIGFYFPTLSFSLSYLFFILPHLVIEAGYSGNLSRLCISTHARWRLDILSDFDRSDLSWGGSYSEQIQNLRLLPLMRPLGCWRLICGMRLHTMECPF
ncbi:hypothetical protein C8Q69DRAFT_455487 [Paecilomyces variotii]|uniref:Uncharacterized protein n=1 Tax=Byssochlamys spectabilis TaxID=264951 RepID=A0A443I073_BYSSP|nr:hypothetical protein C8Q69DRAFT_455487 [Paecilomyces variotii]RWQ97451.1 hypothetical protein C8Q69DRAFT_455487 [Paecilomyces variotii]